jgi:hypothetical protein
VAKSYCQDSWISPAKLLCRSSPWLLPFLRAWRLSTLLSFKFSPAPLRVFRTSHQSFGSGTPRARQLKRFPGGEKVTTTLQAGYDRTLRSDLINAITGHVEFASGAEARDFVGHPAARLKPCPFKAIYETGSRQKGRIPGWDSPSMNIYKKNALLSCDPLDRIG